MAKSKKSSTKKKRKDALVQLRSSASSYFKVVKKSRKMILELGGPKKTGKLTGLKLYDPVVRKHVEFTEKKVSK